MKVILKQDVKGSGKKGEVVEVNSGYANNYLLPKKLAEVASSTALNSLIGQQKAEEFKRNTEKEKAQSVAKQLKGFVLDFKIKAGENGKLFGSVTSKEISEALKKQGFDIDKKQINLSEQIKALGRYVAEAKLFAEVSATFTVNVIAA